MGLEKEAGIDGKKEIKRPDDDHQDPNIDHDHDQQHKMNINHGDQQVQNQDDDQDKALSGQKKPLNVPPNTNKNKRKGVDMIDDDFSSIATPKRQRGLSLSSNSPKTTLPTDHLHLLKTPKLLPRNRPPIPRRHTSQIQDVLQGAELRTYEDMICYGHFVVLQLLFFMLTTEFGTIYIPW
ncbi:hypothetical protein TIFTF001_028961 [Ficus carica]|uniref:Uncharacterized protein n=1 Tax=Ficus carica TaxID=3494 RepID=A0AA88DQP4_FICCA|nr:hypothetical protein TIFTF001_028961 [Ficus carica]